MKTSDRLNMFSATRLEHSLAMSCNSRTLLLEHKLMEKKLLPKVKKKQKRGDFMMNGSVSKRKTSNSMIHKWSMT